MQAYAFDMSSAWPNLTALELLVAVVEEGSLGAGARRVGMAQPNASRLVARLEVQAGTKLLQRSPRGSRATATGLLLADQARTVLSAAQQFSEVLGSLGQDTPPAPLRVGASMTIAECLLPEWLARLRRRAPEIRVEPTVLNSAQVAAQVREGALDLGFVETPVPPAGLNTLVVHEDELVVVVAPDHPWARRRIALSLDELARTPLVVREPGSGTREALDGLLAGLRPVPPSQVLQSNAAVRVAVAAGQAPAALSRLAVRQQLGTADLVQVPLESTATRPLTAIWAGPRRLSGSAAAVVSFALEPVAPA